MARYNLPLGREKVLSSSSKISHAHTIESSLKTLRLGDGTVCLDSGSHYLCDKGNSGAGTFQTVPPTLLLRLS